MPTIEKPRNHVKSYFAGSIKEAMERAVEEMGPDALLLDTREAPPEARHLGEYEVVFGCMESAPAAGLPARPQGGDGIDVLRRQVEEIRELLTRSGMKFVASPAPSPKVASTLIEAGVEPKLAAEIEAAVQQRLAVPPVARMGEPRVIPLPDTDRLLHELREEMNSRFDVKAEIGRVTALVGPPGSGKTTTIVKLAVTHGLAANRPVRLITTDTHRIGGADQLRTYAAILGVPLQAVDSVMALEQAIEAAPENALVLIDTPGYSAVLLNDLGGPLAGFLSRRQDIDTHLVLTASTRIEDLYHLAGLYEIFQPAKLLFTRTDETTSLGSAFCVAARLRRPLSFLSSGQSVPEDLAPAVKERIAESLVHELPLTLEAVA